MVVTLDRIEVRNFCDIIIHKEMEEMYKRRMTFDVAFVDGFSDVTIGNQFDFWYDGYNDKVVEMGIEIPNAYKDEYDFYNNLCHYLLDFLDFDIKKYRGEIDVTDEEVMILYCLSHELGHMKQCIKEINEHGDFVTYKIECERRFDIEIEDFLGYRMLPSERYADMFAVEMLEKYKNILKDYVKKINRFSY